MLLGMAGFAGIGADIPGRTALNGERSLMKVLAGRLGKASLTHREGSGLGGASSFPKDQSRPHQEDDQENASERKGAVTRQIHGQDILGDRD